MVTLPKSVWGKCDGHHTGLKQNDLTLVRADFKPVFVKLWIVEENVAIG